MRRAFTLAEVMIAILFLSIALFAYVSLQVRLIYSASKLEVHQQWCEQTNSDLVGNVVTTWNSIATTQEVPGCPPGLRLVRATNTWDDRNGTHTFTMDTYVRAEVSGWANPAPSPPPPPPPAPPPPPPDPGPPPGPPPPPCSLPPPPPPPPQQVH